MSTPTSNASRVAPPLDTIVVPPTGVIVPPVGSLPTNGPAAPTLQQPIGTPPVNDIKSEWTKSMILMQGNLDNMNNSLAELKVLLGQLKILIGDQVPTDVDELIQSVDSTKKSTNDLQSKIFELKNKVGRFNFNAINNSAAVNTVIDNIKRVCENFSNVTLSSTQPIITSGNTVGTSYTIPPTRQGTGTNTGKTSTSIPTSTASILSTPITTKSTTTSELTSTPTLTTEINKTTNDYKLKLELNKTTIEFIKKNKLNIKKEVFLNKDSIEFLKTINSYYLSNDTVLSSLRGVINRLEEFNGKIGDADRKFLDEFLDNEISIFEKQKKELIKLIKA